MSRADDSELADAIACFARGFAFTRHLRFPCAAETVDRAWCVRDGPRRNPRDYRVEEWIAAGMAPDRLLSLARNQTRGRFKICHLLAPADDEAAVRSEYRRLKCRLMATEPMMVHDLRRLPRSTPPEGYQIQPVDSDDRLKQLVAANPNKRLMRPEHLLADSPVRGYVAIDPGGRIVGSVRSIRVGVQAWVAGLGVDRDHRRRGLGKALMAAMLDADRKNGVQRSVLLASHTGAMLYPTVGYRQIATLMLYIPPR